MSYHSGALIDGNPVVCGGYIGGVDDLKCFHYERDTKQWKRVTYMHNFDGIMTNQELAFPECFSPTVVFPH